MVAAWKLKFPSWFLNSSPTTLFLIISMEKANGFLLISWLDRVRIAMEIAYAICYMHCGRSRPIVHLDNSFTAKLSNFGFAVSIAPGERLFSR